MSNKYDTIIPVQTKECEEIKRYIGARGIDPGIKFLVYEESNSLNHYIDRSLNMLIDHIRAVKGITGPQDDGNSTYEPNKDPDYERIREEFLKDKEMCRIPLDKRNSTYKPLIGDGPEYDKIKEDLLKLMMRNDSKILYEKLMSEDPEYNRIKEDKLKNEDILNQMAMFHVKREES